MNRKMSVTQVIEGVVEIVIAADYGNEVFIIKQTDIGLSVFGKFVSKAFDTATGSICLSPIGDGKIELYIG